jgi:hypothetical protein
LKPLVSTETSVETPALWVKACNLLWAVLTVIVVGLLVVKAWVDVDNGWDTWTYHIPFAGRFWGLIPEALYQFDATIQQRWEGFALLGEWLQGGLWALTGHIEASNFVSLLSLLAFVGVLARRFSVPLTVSLPALLAVPLIHFHATTSYVDLPAALWFSVGVLLLADMLVRPEGQTRKSLLLAVLSGAVAANIKTLYAPLFCVCLLLWLAIVLWPRGGAPQVQRIVSRRFLVVLLPMALGLILAVPIKNTVLWGNPLHGVLLKVGETVVSDGENFSRDVPTAHVNTPGPVRWVLSILELQNPLFSWSSGQTANIPPEVVKARRAQLKTESDIDALQKAVPWYRFGGFFGAYVVLNVLLLAFLLRRYYREANSFEAEANVTLGLMLLVTGLAALTPMSFHLRYCLYWVIILLSLNLSLLWRLPLSFRSKTAIHGVYWSVFLFVFWVTGMRQIIPAKYTFALHRQRVQQLVHWEAPKTPEAICFTGFPYTVLFSAPLQDNAHSLPQYKLHDYGPERILSGPLGGKLSSAPCANAVNKQ